MVTADGNYEGSLTTSKPIEAGKYYTATISLAKPGGSQVLDDDVVATPEEDIIGSGNASDPYLITSPGDMLWFLENNNGTDSYGKYYKLTTDMDIVSSPSDPWSFCDITSPWVGTFDGGGNSITGELVANPYDFSFGFIGANMGTIQNLNVEAEVVGSGFGYDIGPMFAPGASLTVSAVGAVAGINMGNIDNCTSSGSVVSEPIENLPDGSMVGAGGIVGLSLGGSITNSTSSADIVGADATPSDEDDYVWSAAAGIVGGIAGGTVSGCSNSGSITAGSVSSGESIAAGVVGMGMTILGPIVVSDCTNSGNISGTTSADNETSITAGLVGWLQGDSNHTGEVTSAITGCSNTGAITGGECHDYGDSFTGGIGAVVTMADILGCTNEASATVTAGNAQDGWVYAGGIVSYFSSHSDANMTAQVHTTISDCANYAAINGAMKGDWE